MNIKIVPNFKIPINYNNLNKVLIQINKIKNLKILYDHHYKKIKWQIQVNNNLNLKKLICALVPKKIKNKKIIFKIK